MSQPLTPALVRYFAHAVASAPIPSARYGLAARLRRAGYAYRLDRRDNVTAIDADHCFREWDTFDPYYNVTQTQAEPPHEDEVWIHPLRGAGIPAVIRSNVPPLRQPEWFDEPAPVGVTPMVGVLCFALFVVLVIWVVSSWL